MKLADRVVIVTGSSKGIGEGIARIFSQEGARVVIVCRTESAGQRMAEELGSSRGKALYIRTDVTSSESIRSMIDETIKTYGKLDILVNNAGYHLSKNIEETTEDQHQSEEHFPVLKICDPPSAKNEREHH